jgi:hypothetical protein
MLQRTTIRPTVKQLFNASTGKDRRLDLFDWLSTDFSRRRLKFRAESGEKTLNIC